MRRLAKPMLFVAAFIWGSSFFIMKGAVDVIPTFYLLAIRFTGGAALLALLCWKRWKDFTRDYLWRGAVIGGFLFLAYSVQTFGLAETTPSKNAFLTAVYCVLVPFFYWFAAGKRPDRYNILAALLCVSGVGLVSLTETFTVTRGDALTLCCAIFYASHIVAVSKVSPGKDIYLLTVFQFFWAAVYAWIGGMLFQDFPPAETLLSVRYAGADGLSHRDGHHGGPPVPECGAGVVRPLLGVGDFVSGVGVRGAVFGALLRRPGDRPAAAGLRADLCGGGLFRDQVPLPAPEERSACGGSRIKCPSL